MALQPPTGAGPIAGVNLTPLIDIMLVLLLVTMVVGGTANSTVSVDLPKGSAETLPSPEEATFEVTLDERGALTIAGQPVDRDAFIAAARAHLDAHQSAHVVIAAAAGSRHEAVMEVLFSLQRAGADDVSFRTLGAGGDAP